MSAAAVALAEVVEETCDVHHALAYRPSRLDSKMAFVAPSDIWKQIDEENTYCGFTVGLDVWLVAGAAEQRESLDWLDVQSSLLLGLDAVDVGTDRAFVSAVDAPIVLSTADGSSFLACRLQYSRFTIGE